MSSAPVPEPSERPRGILLIAAILVLEAVATVVLAIAFIGTILGADAISIGGSAFMAVVLLLLGFGLVAMATRLMAGFRWPRSPSLVLQIFLVILAFPYFSAGNPLIGLALLAPAAAIIILLFSKPVVHFTVRTNGPQKLL